jgi:hypothetical protein
VKHRERFGKKCEMIERFFNSYWERMAKEVVANFRVLQQEQQQQKPPPPPPPPLG